MTAPLIELHDVDVRLGGRPALSGVSLVLRAGESWAVLGTNGSGKSTLLRLLRGELWPHHEGPGRRLFHLGGVPEESPIGVRERIGLVSAEQQQEYLRREWTLPVEAVVRSGFTDSVWPPDPATPTQARRIAEVLAAFRLDGYAARSVLELSTGELRKVLLARALAGRPRLLFLDEPCHGLDAPSRAGFLGLVSEVVRAGTPIVLATHRHDELVPEITQVAVLHGGRILAQGPRDDVLRRHRTRPRPAAFPGRAAAAVEGRTGPTRTLVSISHADVRVDGKAVLHDVSWTVRAGESWAVVGPNGAGKSTLLRLVVGDEQVMPGGRVSRLDLGERADVWEVKARVGIVSPELQARHRGDVRAEDVAASGFTASIGLAEDPSPEERARAARCMERVGVAHLAGRTVHAISYGEFRKLLLARALVRDPELLVLDEPCDGLDPASRVAFLETVEDLCRRGTQVVMVTHHEEDLVPSITHVLALAAGRVAYRGPRSGWRAAGGDGGSRPS